MAGTQCRVAKVLFLQLMSRRTPEVLDMGGSEEIMDTLHPLRWSEKRVLSGGSPPEETTCPDR
jgi:hypothetical protein